MPNAVQFLLRGMGKAAVDEALGRVLAMKYMLGDLLRGTYRQLR